MILSALAMEREERGLSREPESISGRLGWLSRLRRGFPTDWKMLKAGEADTVVIAGMGGELEIHILEEGRHIWDSAAQWVLSPQSDLEHVRRYLLEHGVFH